jgi:hypothetical protein
VIKYCINSGSLAALRPIRLTISVFGTVAGPTRSGLAVKEEYVKVSPSTKSTKLDSWLRTCKSWSSSRKSTLNTAAGTNELTVPPWKGVTLQSVAKTPSPPTFVSAHESAKSNVNSKALGEQAQIVSPTCAAIGAAITAAMPRKSHVPSA